MQNQQFKILIYFDIHDTIKNSGEVIFDNVKNNAIKRIPFRYEINKHNEIKKIISEIEKYNIIPNLKLINLIKKSYVIQQIKISCSLGK